jgi:hypothetical protein
MPAAPSARLQDPADSRVASLTNTSEPVCLLVLLCSGALPRGDDREGRPTLFYLVTTAVRAACLFRVMLGDGQSLCECFLADVAETNS